ncbi:hypothetical protein BJV82DRAFT_635579 [Fennellomyces sp. T-0311]|nr:hypothetical protein BJV82DRAFT_635579 [Fennellomyces sp. T-0311]
MFRSRCLSELCFVGPFKVVSQRAELPKLSSNLAPTGAKPWASASLIPATSASDVL